MTAEEFWIGFTERRICVRVFSAKQKNDVSLLVREHGLRLGDYARNMVKAFEKSGEWTGDWGGCHLYMDKGHPDILTGRGGVPEIYDKGVNRYEEMEVVMYDDLIRILDGASVDAESFDFALLFAT